LTTYPFTTALVTGASSGIGEAMAHELGRAGVPTVLVARRRDRLQEIADAYDGFEVLEADLTTRSGQAVVMARIGSSSSPVDLVVNNAGFGTSGSFHELDVDRVTDEIELNVVALTRLSSAALEAMVGRGRGWLLNVSSVVSFQSAPNLAVYAATKAFVTSFTESVHAELKGTGVVATALCPGLTRTEFQSVSSTESYNEQVPDFMWSTAEDVARTGLRDTAAGKVISVPGAVYKTTVAISGITPRPISRFVAALVQRQ
jgi:short-subunit dehydrogenase